MSAARGRCQHGYDRHVRDGGAQFQFTACVQKHYTPSERAIIANKQAGRAAHDDNEAAEDYGHPQEPRGQPLICLDVTNDYSEHFVQAGRSLRSAFREHAIIAGNIVTGEMVEQLLMSGADIIMVGIGSGSVCTARMQTGMEYPQLSAVLECADAAHVLNGHLFFNEGYTCWGDMAKAFGAGAEFVMLGRMFVAHGESGCDKIEMNSMQMHVLYSVQPC
ncbi:GMP reductase [Phytophthora ramorum]|uniref:GMP reductase n=1 Tax=Phytophthora ramorum TaxID=164328 RepID=UPI0030A759E0|nr:GMP reductase [Phytophthora ramorum]